MLLEGIINQQVRQKIGEWATVFQVQPKSIGSTSPIEIARLQASNFTGLDMKTPIREAYFTPEVSRISLTDEQMRKMFGIRSKLVGLVWPLYATHGENFQSGKTEGGYTSYFNGDRKFFSRIEAGSIYTFSTLLEDDYSKDGLVGHTRYNGTIGVGLTVNLVTITCKLGWQYMQEAGWERLRVDYNLRNIRGRKLIIEDFARVGFHYERSAIADNIESSVVLTNGPDQHKIETIKNLLEELFSYFDWKPESKQLEEDITNAWNKSYIEHGQLFLTPI